MLELTWCLGLPFNSVLWPNTCQGPLKAKREANTNDLTTHKYELFHWLVDNCLALCLPHQSLQKFLLRDFPSDVNNEEQRQWLSGDQPMKRWKCLLQKCDGVPSAPCEYLHLLNTGVKLQLSHSTATRTPFFEKKNYMHMYMCIYIHILVNVLQALNGSIWTRLFNSTDRARVEKAIKPAVLKLQCVHKSHGHLVRPACSDFRRARVEPEVLHF